MKSGFHQLLDVRLNIPWALQKKRCSALSRNQLPPTRQLPHYVLVVDGTVTDVLWRGALFILSPWWGADLWCNSTMPFKSAILKAHTHPPPRTQTHTQTTNRWVVPDVFRFCWLPSGRQSADSWSGLTLSAASVPHALNLDLEDELGFQKAVFPSEISSCACVYDQIFFAAFSES